MHKGGSRRQPFQCMISIVQVIHSPNSSRMINIGGPTALATSLDGDAALTKKPIDMAVKVVSRIVTRKMK